MLRRPILLLALTLAFPTLSVAQEITVSFAWLALGAPLLTVIAAIAAAVAARSWLVALASISLIAFWIAFYLVAAEYVTNDVFFWLPVIGLHLQMIASFLWLVWRLLRSKRRSQ